MQDTYNKNLLRLTEIATATGVILNSDQQRVEKVVGLMANNYDLVGEWVCPCKQSVKPAQKGKDVECPCPEWLDEINKMGHCHCKLFFAITTGE